MHFVIDCSSENIGWLVPKLYVHIHSCSRSAMC
jgi:hypothetical protein